MAQTVSAEFGKEEGLSSNLRVCIKSDVGTMIVPNTFFFPAGELSHPPF